MARSKAGIGKVNVLHEATAQYVDQRLRPETCQPKAMADAAAKWFHDELGQPKEVVA